MQICSTSWLGCPCVYDAVKEDGQNHDGGRPLDDLVSDVQPGELADFFCEAAFGSDIALAPPETPEVHSGLPTDIRLREQEEDADERSPDREDVPSLYHLSSSQHVIRQQMFAYTRSGQLVNTRRVNLGT